jgi:valyl-tRNA synthetase
MPHVGEAIYRRAGGHTTQSVHETRWPVADAAWAAPELVAQMRQIQRLAALGRTARIQAGIDLDRPAGRTLIHALKERDRDLQGLAPLQPVLAEALRSTEVLFTPAAMARIDWLLALKQERAVERSIAAAEIDESLASLTPAAAADLASQLRDGLSVSFEAGQQSITLLPDEVDITIKSHPGWAAASDVGFVIALEVG